MNFQNTIIYQHRWGIVGCLLFFLVGSYALNNDNEAAQRFYDNKVSTKGMIYSYHTPYRSAGTQFDYRYSVAGVEYGYSVIVDEIPSLYGDHFCGRSFPVIYEKDNPSNNKMLIAPYQFRMYGVKFPDSLKWVRKFVKNTN